MSRGSGPRDREGGHWETASADKPRGASQGPIGHCGGNLGGQPETSGHVKSRVTSREMASKPRDHGGHGPRRGPGCSGKGAGCSEPTCSARSGQAQAARRGQQPRRGTHLYISASQDRAPQGARLPADRRRGQVPGRVRQPQQQEVPGDQHGAFMGTVRGQSLAWTSTNRRRFDNNNNNYCYCSQSINSSHPQ